MSCNQEDEPTCPHGKPLHQDCYQCNPYPEEDDALDDDDYDPGEECGRWINGRLGKLCTLAGTEWCDWECPYSR